jgi:hypothetical protein
MNSPRHSIIFLGHPATCVVSAESHPQHGQHKACHPLSPCVCADFKAFGSRKGAAPFTSTRQNDDVHRSWLKQLPDRFASLQWCCCVSRQAETG